MALNTELLNIPPHDNKKDGIKLYENIRSIFFLCKNRLNNSVNYYFGLVVCIFMLADYQLFAQHTLIKGIYQGENLYVQNPFGPDGVGFCVTKVLVNGQATSDAINSSAFEVDLEVFNFKFGDSLNIDIHHKKGCKPIILNIADINPKSNFNILSISYDKKTSKLNWTSKDEISSLPFIVEQFRWRKWVKVAEVQGKGTPGQHSYSAKVIPHSGKNRFRVKQIDYSKKPRYSQEIIYRSLSPLISFSPAKPKSIISFSDTTNFEIFDFYGQLLKKGRAKLVNISKLKKGDYFLNYDNSTGMFHKK